MLPALEEFQIGWICALQVEVTAALEMLDEDFGTLEHQSVADSKYYSLGRIGVHDVVIACLPMGQYRTTFGRDSCKDMMHTFSKSLRIGMMVGIAGGIPSASHDIRLGDVVVSKPDLTFGGVFQHDMGKIGRDGKMQRTGALNSRPRALLNALTRMSAEGGRNSPRNAEGIKKATQRTIRQEQHFAGRTREAIVCSKSNMYIQMVRRLVKDVRRNGRLCESHENFSLR